MAVQVYLDLIIGYKLNLKKKYRHVGTNVWHPCSLSFSTTSLSTYTNVKLYSKYEIRNVSTFISM